MTVIDSPIGRFGSVICWENTVSFQAAPLAMQAFFVGNWVWMTATVGLLYQNAPQQLCVNYLIGTQLSAGEGLVAAAVAIAGLWCVYAVPAYLDMTDDV